MARRDLPDADPLDGTESLILVQKSRARRGWVGLVCDYVMACVQAALTTALAPVLVRLLALEGADVAQSARDRAQDTALAQEAVARKAADDAEALARQAVSAALSSETQARQQADATEASARSGADQTLTSGLASETQARQAAATIQAARDTAQDQALAGEATARKTADDAEVAARTQADSAEAATRSSTDTAQAARLAGLEARAEEAVHFTASAKLPAIALLADVPLVLSVTPVKAGDALKAGEDIVVEPGGALPAGVLIASARVTADNVVTLQLRATIALSAQTTATPWSVVALR